MFIFEIPTQELNCTDIGLYSSKYAPKFETEEELIHWAQGKGDIILQVRCDDGLMFLVKKIDWGKIEYFLSDQYRIEKGNL